MLVFGKNQQGIANKNRICIENFSIGNREGWLKDLKARHEKGEVDYMLILWCLRKFATADGFFFDSPYTNNNNSTQPGTVPTPNTSISKIKPNTRISLLMYKNLRVDGQPGTLTFYINGEKIAEPIARCFTH